MASLAAFGGRALSWIGTILFGGREGERAEPRSPAQATSADLRTSRRATYQPPASAMAATTILGGWSPDSLGAPGDLGTPGDGRSMASKYGVLEGGSWRDTLEGGEWRDIAEGGPWKRIIESGGAWKRLLQPPPLVPYQPGDEDLAVTWARAAAAASKVPLPPDVTTMPDVAPPLPPPLVEDY
jgi:hypothetical protein